MKLEAVKPSRGGLATGRHALEDLVTADAFGMAHFQSCAVDEADAAAPAFVLVQQERQRQGQGGHQSDKTFVTEHGGKVPAVDLTGEAVPSFEVPIIALVKGHDQTKPLGKSHEALALPAPAALLLTEGFRVREVLTEVVKLAE